MKKELATLCDHAVIVLAVIVIEWVVKGVLHYAGVWGYVPAEAAEAVSTILNYFLIVSILLFCVTCLICLAKNSLETIRKY